MKHKNLNRLVFYFALLCRAYFASESKLTTSILLGTNQTLQSSSPQDSLPANSKEVVQVKSILRGGKRKLPNEERCTSSKSPKYEISSENESEKEYESNEDDGLVLLNERNNHENLQLVPNISKEYYKQGCSVVQDGRTENESSVGLDKPKKNNKFSEVTNQLKEVFPFGQANLRKNSKEKADFISLSYDDPRSIKEILKFYMENDSFVFIKPTFYEELEDSVNLTYAFPRSLKLKYLSWNEPRTIELLIELSRIIESLSKFGLSIYSLETCLFFSVNYLLSTEKDESLSFFVTGLKPQNVENDLVDLYNLMKKIGSQMVHQLDPTFSEFLNEAANNLMKQSKGSSKNIDLEEFRIGLQTRSLKSMRKMPSNTIKTLIKLETQHEISAYEKLKSTSKDISECFPKVQFTNTDGAKYVELIYDLGSSRHVSELWKDSWRIFRFLEFAKRLCFIMFHLQKLEMTINLHDSNLILVKETLQGSLIPKLTTLHYVGKNVNLASSQLNSLKIYLGILFDHLCQYSLHKAMKDAPTFLVYFNKMVSMNIDNAISVLDLVSRIGYLTNHIYKPMAANYQFSLHKDHISSFSLGYYASNILERNITTPKYHAIRFSETTVIFTNGFTFYEFVKPWWLSGSQNEALNSTAVMRKAVYSGQTEIIRYHQACMQKDGFDVSEIPFDKKPSFETIVLKKLSFDEMKEILSKAMKRPPPTFVDLFE